MSSMSRLTAASSSAGAETAEGLASVLGALANEKRLAMLKAALGGPQSFAELQEVVGLGKTALSHHLALLVKSGLLEHTGKGQYKITLDGAEYLQSLTSVYDGSRKRIEMEAARRADYILKAHLKKSETSMKKLDVRIVKLEPMHVASTVARSRTPERDAWEIMRAWAEPKGFLADTERHPVYGFNSPEPSGVKGEYGYEFWMKVDPGTQPGGGVKVKRFDGGTYAVTTCRLKEEMASEFFKREGRLESWKKLEDWVRANGYRPGRQQCLEKAHDPGAAEDDLVLDLYFPIEA